MNSPWRGAHPPLARSPEAGATLSTVRAWTFAVRTSLAALVIGALVTYSCALAAAAAVLAVGGFYDTMDRQADALGGFRVALRCVSAAVLALGAAVLLLAWALACWPLDLMPRISPALMSGAHRPLSAIGVLLVASTAVLIVGRSLALGTERSGRLPGWPPMGLAVVALASLAWGLQIWASRAQPDLVPAVATAFTAAVALLLTLLAVRLTRFANWIMNDEFDPRS